MNAQPPARATARSDRRYPCPVAECLEGPLKHKCKKPHRQGKPVRQAIEFLRRIGASAIELVENVHLHLAWVLHGKKFVITIGRSSRRLSNAFESTRKAILRKIHLAGLVVPA